jgi:hypothetical protein
MRADLLTVICAAALVLGACSEKPAATGSCAAGETASETPPRFCYKVPEGFKPKGEPLKREGWQDTTYTSEDKAAIHFIVRDLDSFDRAWKALQGNAASSKASDVKEEEFADGKGKILTYTTPEKDPRSMISVMLRGAKNTIECEAEYRASAPKPELLDACRSIREP